MSHDGALMLAQERLQDVVRHARILAVDADAQNAWLHPCGWTRQEPFVHSKEHAPCAPVAELVDSFAEWPGWRQIVAPAISANGHDVLDQLVSQLRQLDVDDLCDAIEALDRRGWMEVRRVAKTTVSELA